MSPLARQETDELGLPGTPSTGHFTMTCRHDYTILDDNIQPSWGPELPAIVTQRRVPFRASELLPMQHTHWSPFRWVAAIPSRASYQGGTHHLVPIRSLGVVQHTNRAGHIGL